MRIALTLLRYLHRFYYIPMILAAFGSVFLNYFDNEMSGMLAGYVAIVKSILSGYVYGTVGATGSSTSVLWGYGWLMLLCQDKLTILVLQNVVALSSMFYFIHGMEHLRRTPVDPKISLCFKVAMVFAFSWHAFNSSEWPQSIATSFYLAAMMMFVQAFDTPGFHPWRLVGSGLLFGLGLNFRSDYLMFAVAIAFVVVIMEGFDRHASYKLATWLFVIILLMTPWMMYTKQVTGHALLSSTNGGAALIGGLGNLPGNKWGYAMDDGCVMKIVHDEMGPNVWYTSYAADVFLKRKFWSLVRQDPGEYLRKVVHVLTRQATFECEAACFHRHPLCRPNAIHDFRFPSDYLVHVLGSSRRDSLEAASVAGFMLSKTCNRILLPGSFLLLFVTIPVAACRKDLFLLVVISNIVYQLLVQCLVGHTALRTMNSYVYLILNMIVGIGLSIRGVVVLRDRLRERFPAAFDVSCLGFMKRRSVLAIVVPISFFGFLPVALKAMAHAKSEIRLDHYRQLAEQGSYRSHLSLLDHHWREAIESATRGPLPLANDSKPPFSDVLLGRISTRDAKAVLAKFRVRVEGCRVSIVAKGPRGKLLDQEKYFQTVVDEYRDSEPGRLLFELHGEEYVDLVLRLPRQDFSEFAKIRFPELDVYVFDSIH